MPYEIKLDAAYRPSENVVAREIEGELIIVPITAGVGDMEDELYTLNDTGKAVWHRLTGSTSVREIISCLADEYDAPFDIVETDVTGLLTELLSRTMVVEIFPDNKSA